MSHIVQVVHLRLEGRQQVSLSRLPGVAPASRARQALPLPHGRRPKLPLLFRKLQGVQQPFRRRPQLRSRGLPCVSAVWRGYPFRARSPDRINWHAPYLQRR